jgi:hypothetical protein
MWQHARSPVEEGTGQFGPQQGVLKAASDCAMPQFTPTVWSAITNARNAKISFLTGTTLFLWGVVGKPDLRRKLHWYCRKLKCQQVEHLP